MKEIITLQLGHESNHLATHFWNAQESYFSYEPREESRIDHDVHWRQGISADGSDTFTPRTVIYDLKGGFGSMRKINALYEEPVPQPDPAGSSLWAGPQTVKRLPEIPVTDYQQSLDQGNTPKALTTSSVRYWSDYNRVFYHPRSIVQINDYDVHSSPNPFDKWAAGDLLFQTLDREHDLVDRDLRPFVEEADQMQGIQLLTSIHDAWSGFASRYIEALRDDHPKSSIWVWAVQPPFGTGKSEARLQSLTNTARAIVDVSRQGSLMLPLGLDRAVIPRSTGFDMTSSWHTSSLLSVALETATLPSRLKPGAGSSATLNTMTEAVVKAGKRRLANVTMQVGGDDRAGDQVSIHPNGQLGAHNPGDSELKLDLSFATGPSPGRPTDYLAATESHVFAKLSSSRGFRYQEDSLHLALNPTSTRCDTILRRQAPFSSVFLTLQSSSFVLS
ncbi:dml-1 [Zalerion maritima]|uniref:Dml-1 n=1 Tax=Zalerion maritima TaxID=339359 RepID=A0AAD5WU56_9PEZI|nr:dml-1 [Zalerion maritima]